MNRGPVPEQQDFAGHLAVQRLEEGDDLRAFDRADVQAKAEVPPAQAGDGGDILPVEVEREYRGLPNQRPGPGPMWPLAQPALVEEDDGPTLLAGFFLRRGHCLVFQSAIFASSRSRARPTGRWGLKPSWPSRRQT